LSPWLVRRSRATLRRDRAYLREPMTQLPLPGTVARLARRAAWRALLSYAHRLPGFAESSFSHLWQNFLAGPAWVRSTGREIEVVLEPPALQVIWKLSGADRANYSLPDGTVVAVRERSR